MGKHLKDYELYSDEGVTHEKIRRRKNSYSDNKQSRKKEKK